MITIINFIVVGIYVIIKNLQDKKFDILTKIFFIINGVYLIMFALGMLYVMIENNRFGIF
jgi:threonine/homoserine/homoserine lactone efflux protein